MDASRFQTALSRGGFRNRPSSTTRSQRFPNSSTSGTRSACTIGWDRGASAEIVRAPSDFLAVVRQCFVWVRHRGGTREGSPRAKLYLDDELNASPTGGPIDGRCLRQANGRGKLMRRHFLNDTTDAACWSSASRIVMRQRRGTASASSSID